MRDIYKKRRREMVMRDLRARGIKDQRVLEAMSKIPREKFVTKDKKEEAYSDHPLLIGYGQTISQPFVVARMCELLELKGNERVMDVGTGSGYEAAVLSLLCKKVYSIEVVEELIGMAKNNLRNNGFTNVEVFQGNARKGLPDKAPFDAIKSAAASNDIPDAWKNQLKDGGRIVAPVGEFMGQNLIRLKKEGDEFRKEVFGGVSFVPLVNE